MTDEAHGHDTNRSFYDRISSAYDLIADANEHAMRETGENALNLQHGERVLEIGYGTGNSIVNFGRQVGPDGHVSGLDISPGMQRVAQEKVEAEHLADRVELRVGDGRDLPYASESFDAVFASFTLELFAPDDVPRVLAEIKRVLKPDGRLGIVSMSVVPEGEHESVLEKTYKWMHRHFPHIVDCRPIDVTGVLEQAGFAVQTQIAGAIWTMPVTAAVGVKPA